MRGYRNADRYQAQAQIAATAALQVRSTSEAAAAAEALDAAVGDVTGGASVTIANLKARIDAAGIP